MPKGPSRATAFIAPVVARRELKEGQIYCPLCSKPVKPRRGYIMAHKMPSGFPCAGANYIMECENA